MIKLISKKQTEDGLHEQVWLMSMLGHEPHTFIICKRNKSEVDVDAEVRSERSQVVISNLGKYISMEESNGAPKDQLQMESISRLKDMYNYFKEHSENVKQNCEYIINFDELLKRIARPGRQYYYYLALMQMAKEQIELEKQLISL